LLVLLLLAAAPLRAQQSSPCDRGMELFRRQQFAAAESLLVRCVAQERTLQPLLALCAMALRQERAGAAVRWGDEAVAAAPDSVAAHYWYGRALLASGDRQAAEREWNTALGLDASHAPTLEALAHSKLETADDQAAYGLLTQLARVTGGRPWVHRTLSLLARRRGLWREALDHWRDALAGSEPAAEDYRTAGELAIIAGDTAYAVEAGRLAVAADSSAASLSTLGEALFAANRLDEAVTVLRRARQKDPSLGRVRFNLANVLELRGAFDEAEREFAEYLALEPADPLGRLNYAAHLDGQGRLREALVQLDRATALDSNLTGAWVLKGRVLEKMGDDHRLVSLLDTLQLRPDVDRDEVENWRQQVTARLEEERRALAEGKVELQHIVTPDSTTLATVLDELSRGRDFALLATRYSVGPTAARGGDIGWVDPRDMVADLRKVIVTLAPRQVSPPVRSGGLYHLFKRVR